MQILSLSAIWLLPPGGKLAAALQPYLAPTRDGERPEGKALSPPHCPLGGRRFPPPSPWAGRDHVDTPMVQGDPDSGRFLSTAERAEGAGVGGGRLSAEPATPAAVDQAATFKTQRAEVAEYVW